MVTEPDSPTLDLQAAMRGMDVADMIRRQYGRIPADPEEVDREKVKTKILERYQTLGEAAPSSGSPISARGSTASFAW